MQFYLMDLVRQTTTYTASVINAGSKAVSLSDSQELYTKAASKEKELFILKGATHMDLHDGKQYVPQVAKNLSEFFSKNL